jgi:hypothetical protein
MTAVTAELLASVAKGYLAAGLWADTYEDDELVDSHEFSPADVQHLNLALDRVTRFLELAQADAQAWAIVQADPGQTGHDLWMSANGHGVGFWDRGHGDAGDRLTEMADQIGKAHLYIYEGQIFFCEG